MKLDFTRFDGVAFDFDGTLGKTHEAHQEARAFALDSLGLDAITDEMKAVAHRYGNNPTTIIAGLLKAANYIPEYADPYTDELVTRVVKAKQGKYDEMSQKGFEAERGSIDFVRKTLEKYGNQKVAIVTNERIVVLGPFLSKYKLELDIYGNRLITLETASEHDLKIKPEKDMFEHAAKILGIVAARMLVIEDSLGGVVAAKAAGCPVLAVGNTSPKDVFYSEDKQHEPDYFAASFEDIQI